MQSGTFNFFVEREKHPAAFSRGWRHKWGVFEIQGHHCVVCSDGPTLAATLRMGLPDQTHLFRIQFQPALDRRRHLVAIGWSQGRMKVYLDSKLLATVSITLP